MKPASSDESAAPQAVRTGPADAPRERATSADTAFKIGTVIVLTVLYLLFINRFSFELNGQRYFTLSDDQMISMRYADNLASGVGLVWNPGERVEGFTNPLWTAYMALWHLAGLHRSKTSLPIMLTSAVILILNALVVYSIAAKLSPRSRSVPRVAMILAGTYWSLVHWSLEGFEVGLTALLLSTVVVQAFVYQESQRTRDLLLMAVCLVALGWTRLEMLVVGAVPVAYLLATEPARIRILTAVIVPVGASLVMLFGARFWYFGEWLPNTYYLKLTGVTLGDRLRIGVEKTASVLGTHLSMVIAPVVVTGLSLKSNRRISVLILMGIAAMAYTLYIGGDTWERPYHANRFVSATTPLLVAAALSLTQERVLRDRSPSRVAPVVITVLGVLMAAGLSGRSFRAWMRADVEHRKLVSQVALGELLREEAPPEARIAVVWAGAVPYYSRLYSIDLLGKSDKVIARSAPHNMNPGHNKWNFQHSVGELKPDYILEAWDESPGNLAYLEGQGYSRQPNGIFVRRSPGRQ